MAQARGGASLKAGDGTTAGNLAARGSNALSKLSLAWGKTQSASSRSRRPASRRTTRAVLGSAAVNHSNDRSVRAREPKDCY